ncbi:MAG: DUF4412 domain-containing protein [Acidobacteriota bacterium]
MNGLRIRIAMIAVLLCAAASMMSAQGFYWESTLTGAPGGDHVSKSSMMPRLFKVEQASGKRQTIIVNLDKKVFITVNNAEKTYSETSFDQMEERMKEMGKEADRRMDELQEKMKTMPEEQRKMMEQMVGPMNATGPVEVTQTSEKKTILGYACTKSEVRQGGKLMMSVWATKAVRGFEKMKSDWQEFSERMTSQMPGRFGKAIAEGMRKVEGFPMQTDMGSISTKVTKLESRAIPASAFEIPKGYKKVEEKMFQKKEDR